jgi:hypothetical protein
MTTMLINTKTTMTILYINRDNDRSHPRHQPMTTAANETPPCMIITHNAHDDKTNIRCDGPPYPQCTSSRPHHLHPLQPSMVTTQVSTDYSPFAHYAHPYHPHPLRPLRTSAPSKPPSSTRTPSPTHSLPTHILTVHIVCPVCTSPPSTPATQTRTAQG